MNHPAIPRGRALAAALGLALVTLASADSAAAQPSTVILVRHAERAPEPRADPVLSDLGMQRARDLAAALRHAGVTTVVTTQYQRTSLTARPLMDSTRVTHLTVRAFSPIPAHADSVAAVVRARPAGEVVLVVGHSNTIPAIVAALGGPRFPDLCETQYANLYILRYDGPSPPRLILASYGVSDSPTAADCNREMR